MMRAGLMVLTLAAATAAETATQDLYVRRCRTIDSAVRTIFRRNRSATTFVFAFDTATFAPPPGPSEFTVDHRYREDAAKWLDALEAHAAGRRVLVGSTLSPRLATVDAGDWRRKVQRALDRRWWSESGFAGFGTATAWMRRFLAQAGGLGPSTGPAGERVLVLVTGDILPERWARAPFAGGRPEPWRRRLAKVGAYWDEEKAGALLGRAGCRLEIVAPEARFGDFAPRTELPELPWASRPTFLPQIPLVSKDAVADESRRKLGGSGIPVEGIVDQLENLTSRRFDSRTPSWYPRYGQGLFFNTDCPSAFGYWPYARAAAKSNGHYWFYPYPASGWLDRCPYDPVVLLRLAPELVPAREFEKLRARDPALQALCRAERIVSSKTPWADAGGRWASGWGSFRSVSPLEIQARFRLRDKPWDDPPGGTSVREMKNAGKRVRGLVKVYDEAIAVLAKAQAAGHELAPRSAANLRLGRFWFEVSRFHLHALALFLTEYERFVPPDWKPGDRLSIMYIPTIRLSDCLDGYGRRTLPPGKEAIFGPMRPYRRFRESQSNVLPLPQADPDYRARRALDQVFNHLDKRLRPNADRVLAAARDVMAHEARSPWGWMTYYCDVHTFVFAHYDGPPASLQRPGDGDLRGPTTRRGGGSTSGGPRTR